MMNLYDKVNALWWATVALIVAAVTGILYMLLKSLTLLQGN